MLHCDDLVFKFKMVHVQSTPTEQLDNYIMYNLQLLGLSAALCTLLGSEATMSNEDKHVIAYMHTL